MTTYGTDIENVSIADALVDHASGNLASYSDTLLLCHRGLWIPYQPRLKPRAVLLNIIIKAVEGVGMPPPKVGRSALDDLEPNLMAAAMRERIQKIPVNAVDLHPVIPFTSGHLHLDRGIRETCHCDISGLHMLDHGWEIPPPDWSLLDDLPEIVNHIPHTWFEATSRHMWGPSKDVDIFACPVSGAGKSTTSEAMAMALPGAIAVKQAHTASTNQRRKFSEHVKDLVHSRIVIFDEAGKAEPDVWTSMIFEITPTMVDVELKGQDNIARRRFGNACFMGDVPPKLDASVQGVYERVGFCWEGQLNPVDRQTRARWLSDDEIAKLRVYFLDCALNATPERQQANFHRNDDRHIMLDSMEPDDVKHVRELLHGQEWVSNETIKKALTDGGFKVPPDRQYGGFVIRSFPEATRSQHGPTKGWLLNSAK